MKIWIVAIGAIIVSSGVSIAFVSFLVSLRIEKSHEWLMLTATTLGTTGTLATTIIAGLALNKWRKPEVYKFRIETMEKAIELVEEIYETTARILYHHRRLSGLLPTPLGWFVSEIEDKEKEEHQSSIDKLLTKASELRDRVHSFDSHPLSGLLDSEKNKIKKKILDVMYKSEGLTMYLLELEEKIERQDMCLRDPKGPEFHALFSSVINEYKIEISLEKDSNTIVNTIERVRNSKDEFMETIRGMI